MSGHVLECSRELGKWTIRLNGAFVKDFHRKIVALELAVRLAQILEGKLWTE
jgi:hypothetical protein